MSGQAPVTRDPLAELANEGVSEYARQPLAGDLLGELAEEGIRDEVSRPGWLAWGGLHAANLAKRFADGSAHLAGLALTPVGMALDQVGYDFTGVSDVAKGAREGGILGALSGGQIAMFDPRVGPPMTLDQGYEAFTEAKLGESRHFSDAAGHLLSFVSGPGQKVAELGVAAARPLANVMERVVAKAVNRGTVPDVGEALGRGEFWKILGQSEEWRKGAGMFDRLLAAGGRNAHSLLQPTAANIAQSFALSPDDERLGAAAAASWLTPLMLPVVSFGQKAASWVAAGKLGQREFDDVMAIRARMEAGELTAPEAHKLIREVATPGTGRMAVANLLASSFEGTAFMGFDTQSWRDLRDWTGGDSGAGGRLLARWMGTVSGVLATKYAIPQDVLPIFKQVAPSLNRLNTHIEAEANRRAADQEPKKAAEAAAEQDQARRDVISDRSREGRRKYQEYLDKYEPVQREQASLQEKFGWADHATLAAHRAGFEPVLHHDTGSVDLRFGRDHMVRLAREGDGFRLTVPDDVRRALKHAGRPMPDGDLVGPAAVKALDDVTLLGLYRRLQGDLMFARLGMDESDHSGLWHNPTNGRYYAMQLDGSQAVKRFPGAEWMGTENFGTVGGYGNPSYELPGFAAWREFLTTKQALAPDPLIDGVLTQAILVGQHVKSRGGDQLRELLAQTPPEQLLQHARKDQDDFLALTLGALAAGDNNAMNAVAELARAAPRPAGGAEQGPGAPKGDDGRGSGDPQPVPARPGIEPERAPAPSQDPPAGRPAEEGAAPAPPPSLSDRLEPVPAGAQTAGGPSERGSVGVMPHDVDAARAAAEATGDWTIVDKLFRDLPEALARHADPEGQEFIRKGREALSDTRENLREVEPAQREFEAAVGKAGRSVHEEVPGELPRKGSSRDIAFGAISEGRMKPRTPEEGAAAEAGALVRATTWEQLRRAGAERPNRETGEPEPLPASEGRTMPRHQGKDAPTVFNTPRLLKKWAQDHAEHPKNAARGFTAEKLAEMFGPETASEHKGAVRKSHAEFFREVPYIANRWRPGERGKFFEIVDQSPAATGRTIRQQTARAAVIKAFGPDRPGKLREGSETEFEVPPSGIQHATDEFVKRSRGRETHEIARIWAQHLQSGDPQPGFRWFGEGLTKAEGFARSALTAMSWRWDVADLALAAGPQAGMLRTVLALGRAFRNPKRAIEVARKHGTLTHATGEPVWSETAGMVNRARDVISWIARNAENVKAGAATGIANDFVESMRAGKGAQVADLPDLLAGMGRTADEIATLLSGRGKKSDLDRFRREFVQHVTGQKRPGEGSLLHSNKKANQVLRFMRWAISRQLQTIRTGAMIRSQLARGDFLRAGQTTVRWLTGLGASTTIGSLLSYVLADAFKLEPGWERWWRELTSAPGEFLEMMGAQLVGGPFGQLGRAVVTGVREGPREAALEAGQALGPGSAVLEALSLAHDVTTGQGPYAAGGIEAAWRLGKRVGVAPFGREFESVVGLIALSDEQEKIEAGSAALNRWRDVRGKSLGGIRGDKAAAYYTALRHARDAIRRHPGDSKAAMTAATEALNAALMHEPGETVADSLRHAQFFDGMSDEDKTDFQTYLGDDARMAAMNAHDVMVEDISREIGKRAGTQPQDDFDRDLERAQQLARVGDRDVWLPLVDGVLDRARDRMAGGGSMGSEYKRVARAMAAFPEQLGKVLSDRQLKQIRRMSPGAATMRLSAILRERIMERTLERRREALRER